MSESLAHRYTYGNFAKVPIFNAEADFFLGIPARQRELVSLARAQVAAQESAAQAIVSSNVEAANAIRRELALQTERLEAAIQQGSEAVTSAIGDLGDRISGELGEIRWELLQLRNVSDQILAVLKQPRSTEARELIAQGVRNLVNDKLADAEERFRLALRLDNTDYQVLMNLSAVELRKGNASPAISFVHDALSLPPNLDNQARADALWHLARLHYANRDYGRAVEIAQRSIGVLSIPRRVLQVGIYCILAERLHDGLGHISAAIHSDPQLFAVAASAPDLDTEKQEILALLGSLADQVTRQLRDEARRLEEAAAGAEILGDISKVYVERFRSRVASLNRTARSCSYSECREALVTADRLQGIPERLRVLSQSAAQVSRSNAAATAARQRLVRAGERIKSLPRRTGCLSLTIAGAVQFVITAIVLSNPALQARAQASTPFMMLVLGLPFWLVLTVALKAFSQQRRLRQESFTSFQEADDAAQRHSQEAGAQFRDAERRLSSALERAG